MGWYDSPFASVELGMIFLRRTLTHRRVMETLGMQPSWSIHEGSAVIRYCDPTPREGGNDFVQFVNSCFFNSRAWTDSENIEEHVNAILQMLEPKQRRLRKLARHCHTSFTLRLQRPEPGGKTVLCVGKLLRLMRLATWRRLHFRFIPEWGEMPEDNTSIPHFSYTLGQERGESVESEKIEFGFDVRDPAFRSETKSDDRVEALRLYMHSLIAAVRPRRPLLETLVHQGPHGTWWLDSNCGSLSEQELRLMGAVADVVYFV